MNNDDAKEMLLQIVRSLNTDIQAAVEGLSHVMKTVISSSDAESRIPALQKESEAAHRKKKRLLELYLNGDIAKDDFEQMKLKIEEEIHFIELKLLKASGMEDALANQMLDIAQITATISSIAGGDEWDDSFYRHLLEKMTVKADGDIEILLNFHPSHWIATRSASRCNVDASVSAQANPSSIEPQPNSMQGRCDIGA